MHEIFNELAKQIAVAAHEQAVRESHSFVERRTRELITELVGEISVAALAQVPEESSSAIA